MTDETEFRETVLVRLKSIEIALSDVAALHGRVGRLEDAHHEHTVRHAREDGFVAGKGLAIMTRPQLMALTAMVSTVATVAAFIARFVGT